MQNFQCSEIHWVNNIFAYFETNLVNFFTCLVLGKGRNQWLKSGYHLICPSKRSLFDCSAVKELYIRYGCLFMWRRSSYSQSMFLHGFRLCLWWGRGAEWITYPIIHFSVYGKHDGVNFESVHHSIRMLHLFY